MPARLPIGTRRTGGASAYQAGRRDQMEQVRSANRDYQIGAMRSTLRGPPVVQTVPRTRGAVAYQVGEMKYYDAELATANLVAAAGWAGTEFDPSVTQEASTVANPLCLFAPKQGAQINQRIGRDAKVYKIKIRGHLIVPPTAADAAAPAAGLVRMLLIWDKQTNAAQAQGEVVMTVPETAVALSAVNSYLSLANLGRFTILKDKSIKTGNLNGFNDAATTGSLNGGIYPFKFNHVFRQPVAVRFNAVNGGTVADIVDNSFHLLVNAGSIANVQQIVYTSRVCFKE